MYSLKMPKCVYSGSGSIEQLNVILNKGYKKTVIFTDQGVIGAGLIQDIEDILTKNKVVYTILSDLPAEPSCDQAQQIIERFMELDAELIIAAGGGSVMDIAKLASVIQKDQYTVRDLLENPSRAVKVYPTVMIPSTAGTGAEATPNSIVAVPEKELKVGIINENMIADYVILDPVMIKKLPRAIAASTGIDALAHAIECYTSKKATCFSDLFALEALKMIFNNIKKACDDPEASEAKEAMLIASFYAGIAITASGTTAVHALSYPLGGKYHIPHGVANAMILLPVMKFNEPVCRDKFAIAYDEIYGSGEPLSNEEKSMKLLDQMKQLIKHLEIPNSLKSFGVGQEDLDLLVTMGMQVERLLVNNMREVTSEDARALYLEIM